MRIEICGPIASGKTTLAKLLSTQGRLGVYETFGDNPFLKDFYQQKGVDNTLETEITFVLLHSYLIRQAQANEEKSIVCDYSLYQDWVYGLQNLSREQMFVFEKVYQYVNCEIGKTNLVIYLKCNIDCLMQRIRERDREMETTISENYLRGTVELLESHLEQLPNRLIINSAEIDFRNKYAKGVQDLITKINNYSEHNAI